MSGALDLSGLGPRRIRLSSGLGWVMLLAGLVLFATAADQLVARGYVSEEVGQLWGTGAVPLAIGGQWLVALIVGLVKLVHGAQPQTMVIFTIIASAVMLGQVTTILRRRNWSARQSVLASICIALHPATLFMATSGQPLLLEVMLTAFLVLAVDRAEAHNDTQSLMGLGLSSALLFITTPNAVYVVLPLMTVLPVALREMRSMAAAVSLFILAMVPTIVVVGGIMVGSDTIGLHMDELVQIWSAPLHGVTDARALSVPWLSAHGGRFGTSLWDLLVLCFACTPQISLVTLRVLMRPVERARPATALLTLVLPALSGACAAMFWHISSPWPVVAMSQAVSIAWAMATTLHRGERRMWLALVALGDLTAWHAVLLWLEPDKVAWYDALVR